MERWSFGLTDMRVSPIGLGTMRWGSIHVGEAQRLLDTALDAGMNILDTAPCYPGSEEKVGQVIDGRRSRLLLATKCGCTGPYTDHPHWFDRETLLRNIDDSLLRMKTDHIDLWQLHMQSSDYFPGGEEGEIVQACQT